MTTPTAARRGGPGFTLVELLVSVAVSAVVILGALALLTAQQRSFQTTSGDRTLQDGARLALDAVSAELRLAGFGIDPALAFDFGVQPAVPMAGAPAGTVGATDTLGGCATPVSCRDRTDGPDEIAFAYRDPAFSYPLAVGYAGGTRLFLTGPLRTALPAGQVLQVMCFTGTMAWAYVTVLTTVNPSAAASVPVDIRSGVGNDFPRQNALLADACFNNAAPQGSSATVISGAAKVLKVERRRYFIQSYDDAGTVQDWGTAGARPYLMLDRGLGAVEVIAPDVEDLQAAYIYPASLPANQLVGGTAGTAISADSSGIDLSPAAGIVSFADDASAPTRTTQHPANIRGVRVSVVARSATRDASLNGAADSIIPGAANRADTTGLDGYHRYLLETTAPVRNLDAHAPYYPSYSAGGDQLNVGGG